MNTTETRGLRPSRQSVRKGHGTNNSSFSRASKSCHLNYVGMPRGLYRQKNGDQNEAQLNCSTCQIIQRTLSQEKWRNEEIARPLSSRHHVLVNIFTGWIFFSLTTFRGLHTLFSLHSVDFEHIYSVEHIYSSTFRRAISFVAEVSRKPSLARYLHDRTKSIRDAEARKTGTTGRVAKRMQSWIGF